VFEHYDDMVTVAELSEMLRVSHGMAYKLLKSGKVKVNRVQRTWKIPKAAVIKYVQGLSE
jgi:excisionase family DNA binding protein